MSLKKPQNYQIVTDDGEYSHTICVSTSDKVIADGNYKVTIGGVVLLFSDRIVKIKKTK